MIGIFKPAAHIERLPKNQQDKTYKRMRLQIFLSIFIGYAGYYLVRKNFSLAMPYLIQQGFSSAQLGMILTAVSVAYGLSKFLMGSVSDRSNPRYFLAAGLLLSAGVNIVFGVSQVITNSFILMFSLMFLNGWFQGMGWPSCARSMVHWYSVNERGSKVAIWNVAHNVGGGLIGPLAILGLYLFGDWHSLLYFPAFIAVVIAIFVLLTLKDTPQSVGLPPIEDHRDDHANTEVFDKERELSAKEIFFSYVFRNKFLWYIAIANIFVYFVRYGVIDWAPTYLTHVQGFSHKASSWSYFLYEYAGIPGTLLCGYLSDKVFKGRRAPIGIIYMVGVFFAILAYWLNPWHSLLIYNISLIVIGFLIYGPVMLVGLQALDLVPKKAAGTAAGLTGLFGYLGGAVLADAGLGITVQYFSWSAGFILMLGACCLAIFFFALTWNSGSSHQE